MGPLTAPPGPGPGLTVSGARFRVSGQTGKLTPLLLRLELSELEAALASESDSGAAAAANTIERWLTPRLSPNTRRPAPAPRANQSHTMEGRLGPAPAPRSRPASAPPPTRPFAGARSPLPRAPPAPSSRPPRAVCVQTQKTRRRAAGSGREGRPPAPVLTPTLRPRTPTLLRAHTSWHSGSPGLGRRGGSEGGGAGGRRRGR